jgi:nifR3 family TIM-barrel protein
VKIGTIDLGDKPLFLAPMEDVTDPSFRYICKKFGADMVYTEFVASEALIRNVAKTFQKLELNAFEKPVAVQIYGHVLESMVEAARIVEKEAQPDVIDINFGCPVKKIANRGAGAGLLKNIPLMEQMAKGIVEAVNTPVTVKTRLGWDDETKYIVETAERLQDVGISAIAIHGRTRAQMYRGQADWTLIAKVKNNPRMYIPVIGNGDIDGPRKAKEHFLKYGVDGIMIGRATVGRPWIFREIKEYMNNGNLLPEPLLSEKVALAKDHFQKSLDVKGERVGIYEMRRHFSNYFKGLPNFKDLRLKLLTTMDIQEIFTLLDEINERYEDY